MLRVDVLTHITYVLTVASRNENVTFINHSLLGNLQLDESC